MRDNTLKILHINCNYQGTELHQNMINHLNEFHVKSAIFVPTCCKNISKFKINKNVNISECFKKYDRLIFDYKQKKIFKAIDEEFDIKKYDLVHAYTLFTDGNCAMNLFKKYNIPYVVAIRNTDVNTFFRYMIHLRKKGIEIMRNASAIFFLSKSYMNHVFKKYIPKKYRDEILKKCYVIPNGIDDFWLSNKKIDFAIDIENKLKRINKKELNILYVGRIDKNKNITTTVSAIRMLLKEGYNINFHVIGKITDRKIFKNI